MLWLPVLETLPAPEWFGTGAKLAYVVGVRLVATIVGNVFIWGGAAFYDVYDTGDDYLGLSPSADQSLAGSLMMLEGSIVTIVALAWLFLRMAQEGDVRQELDRERGRRADGPARCSLPALGGADVIGRCCQAETDAGSKRSFSTFGGTRVGYSRVKQARHTESSGSCVASCMPSIDR